MARSTADIQTDLDAWYKARTAAANGRQVSFTTANGSRSWLSQDLGDINSMITLLEREMSQALSTRRGAHNFSVANLNP